MTPTDDAWPAARQVIPRCMARSVLAPHVSAWCQLDAGHDGGKHRSGCLAW